VESCAMIYDALEESLERRVVPKNPLSAELFAENNNFCVATPETDKARKLIQVPTSLCWLMPRDVSLVLLA
jgi:hypothetical protein